jgi:hypothetical protein
MNLEKIQRSMFTAVRQPLTSGEKMRRTALATETAERIVKANNRLTSFERLEIYNRQYWFRIISALADDFDGLRAILGERQFHALATAYLHDCPSHSFTMRNLGSRLQEWLPSHRDFATAVYEIALDMVRLEWAEIEVFDSEGKPTLSVEELARLGSDPSFELQPYIQLLELDYAVHEFLLRVRERKSESIRRRSTRLLPKRRKTLLAIHRIDNSVYFKELTPQAFAIGQALKGGLPLSEALASANWEDRSPEKVSAEVQSLFTNWASLGWFCQRR